MLALLRFVENPRDRVAGFRLMHLIPGVGRHRATACSTHGGSRRSDRDAFQPSLASARRRRLGGVCPNHRKPALFEWPTDLERARLGMSRISTHS